MTAEYDANVRHSIYLERYKSALVRKVVAQVEALTGELFTSVAQSDLEAMSRRELNRFLNQLDAMVATGYVPAIEEIETSLQDLSRYEAEWQAGTMTRLGVAVDLGIPSDADLWAAVNARPFQGMYLKGWLDALPANTAARVRQTVRQGYVDGLGPAEIARQIRGTRNRKGIMDISKRGADAMVRTAVGHTAATASDRLFQANRAIKSVMWLSVLDHRTSPICQARSGNIYPKGEGPRPPAHVNCRSSVIPVTNSNRKAMEAEPNYQDWLSQQSTDVQNDILGPTRGKLYRSGEFTVDRFVDTSGQEYTLDQLRAKDKAAWEDVFGDDTAEEAVQSVTDRG